MAQFGGVFLHVGLVASVQRHQPVDHSEDILDPVPFVTGVSNSTESAGGSDMEDDDRYRLRVVNAFERVSKAGPREGYIENVKAVSPDIIDVKVIRPQPGHIEITPLMANGVSTDEIHAAILARLDPETTVPMGDYVSIVRAVPVPFDVVMTLKVEPGAAADVQSKADDVISGRFAVWTQTLGAQIAPSALVEAARSVIGVVGVDGPAFAFTDLPATSFAVLGQLTVSIVEVSDV